MHKNIEVSTVSQSNDNAKNSPLEDYYGPVDSNKALGWVWRWPESGLEGGCSSEPKKVIFRTYWFIQLKGSPRELEVDGRDVYGGYTKETRVVESVWKPGEQEDNQGLPNYHEKCFEFY